jgi:hypothetical protein
MAQGAAILAVAHRAMTWSDAMFHPDIHYEVQKLRHKELLEEALRQEMIAQIPQRPGALRATTAEMGPRLRAIAAWLIGRARPRPCEPCP